MADVKIGSTCLINGKDSYSNFKADFVSLTPTAGEITSVYTTPGAKSKLDVHNFDQSIGSINVMFYVYGDTQDEMKVNVSKLLSEISESVISTSDDEFEYDCVMSSCEIEYSEIEWYDVVTVTLNAVCRKPLASVNGSGTSCSLSNQGTVISGCRITVTSTSAQNDVKVAGITIKNLVANQPFCIDGIECEVYRLDGVSTKINAFQDTDLIEFPKVKPGSNSFTSSVSLTWKIEWYPLFATV